MEWGARGWSSCLRRKRDYVVAPEYIGGPTSLRKMLLECFFATKTLMREKITAPEGARFPVGRLVGPPMNSGATT